MTNAYQIGIELALIEMEKLSQLPTLLKRPGIIGKLKQLLTKSKPTPGAFTRPSGTAAGRYYPQTPRLTETLESGSFPMKQSRQVTVPSMDMIARPKGLQGFNPASSKLPSGEFQVTGPRGWSFGYKASPIQRPDPGAFKHWMQVPGSKVEVAALRDPLVVAKPISAPSRYEGWGF